MSTNQCLNSSQSQFSKFITDQRVDGTRSTQNFSKLCENCRLVKDDLQTQIFSLKDKAHQSFMQIIQVQQLHQEEMQLMKQEHEDQITALRQQIKKLQQFVTRTKEDFVHMQKNSKRHILEAQLPSFDIQNIEIIKCSQQDQRSNKLDESSYVQFNEFIQGKCTLINDQFSKQVFESNQQSIRSKQYEEKNAKLNQRIFELQSQIQSLWQTNQQLKKQCVKQQNNVKIIKNNYDSLYKESKFMSDHIRNLSNDKFKLERKVKELQKQIKQLKSRSNIKKSSILEQETSPIKIKINGTGLFGNQQYDEVRNSLQNSKDDKEISQRQSFGIQSANFEDTHKGRSSCNIMMKSDIFSGGNGLKLGEQGLIKSQPQVLKSIPNYKKVNHIPSFKKISSQNKEGLKVQEKLNKKNESMQCQKSNIMEEIRKQMQNQQILKKSQLIPGHQMVKNSIFRDSAKKRS